MIKEIYVARDKDGSVWQFDVKPTLVENSRYVKYGYEDMAIKYNTFDITLKPLECVKVTIDTLNQSYRIDRVPSRKDGYYTATSKSSTDVTWILQLKNGAWRYYGGDKLDDTCNMRIGTKPIPKECLP